MPSNSETFPGSNCKCWESLAKRPPFGEPKRKQGKTGCGAALSQVKSRDSTLLDPAFRGKAPNGIQYERNPGSNPPGRVDPMETERWIQWTGFRTCSGTSTESRVNGVGKSTTLSL